MAITTRSQTRRQTRSNSTKRDGREKPNEGQRFNNTRTTKHNQELQTIKKTKNSTKKPMINSKRTNRQVYIARLKKILWELTKVLFPLSKITLKPFLKTHRRTVLLISFILVLTYPISEIVIKGLTNCVVSFVSRPQTRRESLLDLIPAPGHPCLTRSEEVANITSLIESLSSAYQHREVHIYLVGGPGSGKSELARQVGFHLHETATKEEQPRDILTFEADSIDSLTHSIIRALMNNEKQRWSVGDKQGRYKDLINQVRDELNFMGEGLTAEKKLNVLFLAVKELLRERNSHPLLIFDNVRDLKDIFKYLKLEPGRVEGEELTILMTVQIGVPLTRLSKYTSSISLHEGMRQEDAVDLLNLITNLNESSESAYELADILGRQPLALADTAIYIKGVRDGPPKNSHYSYSEHLSEFKRDIELLGYEEQVEWEESIGSSYPDAMFVAVLKAVNRTAQADPVLRGIACAVGLADSGQLSVSFVKEFLRSDSRWDFVNSRVRNTLRNSVFFTVSGDEGDEHLNSHQVTREAFRKVCKVSSSNPECQCNASCSIYIEDKVGYGRDTLKKILTRLVTALGSQLHKGSQQSKHKQSDDPSTSLAVFNSSFIPQFLDVLSSLCIHTSRQDLDVGDILQERFIRESILRYFSRSFDYWPGLIKPVSNEHKLKQLLELASSKSALDSQYGLQTLLMVVCIHNGAAKTGKESLMSSLNNTSHSIIASTERNVEISSIPSIILNILGVMYRGLGYPYQSKTLHERALEIHERTKSDDAGTTKSVRQQLETASTLHQIGVVIRYLGNLQLAKGYHQMSLSLLQGVYGHYHPSVAGSLLNLAVVYSRLGDTGQAIEHCKRSLDIMTKVYGPTHPSVGRVLNTMGTMYYRQRDFDRAIALSERGQNILHAAYGMYHPHVAEALTFLGFMYRDKGDLIKARDLLERSLYIKEQIFDPEHFIVGETMNDLGVVYTRLGEGQRAEVILQRALEIFQQTWGPRHSAVATVTNSLGAAYLAMGQPKKAKALHEKALEIFMEIDMPDSHNIRETRKFIDGSFK